MTSLDDKNFVPRNNMSLSGSLRVINKKGGNSQILSLKEENLSPEILVR